MRSVVGERQSLVRRLAVALVVLAGLGLASTAQAAAPAPRAVDAPRLVRLDGDLVVFEHHDGPAAARSGSSTVGRSYTGDGYSLFNDRAAYRSAYVVRLVNETGADTIRPSLDLAVASARFATGLRLSRQDVVAAGMQPGPGQIDVMVSSSSPCGGAWLACGGPVFSGNEIRSGRIWIHPRALAKSTAELDNILHHELGHALGLGHYDARSDGRIQAMHSVRPDASTYEAGDRRGFAHLSGRPQHDTAIESVTYLAGTVRVVGRSTDRLAAVRIAGKPVTVSTDGRSFQASAKDVPGGKVTACVDITVRGETVAADCRSITAPSVPFGRVDLIEGRRFGVWVAGWAIDPETAAPIDVGVSIDGLATDSRADRSRPDVERVHPGYGAGHGFDTSRLAAPGRHRVCLIARNVGVGVDRTIGCADVVVPLF